MKIKLAYGKEGLKVNVPEKNLFKILTKKKIPALKNVHTKILEELQNPVASESLMKIALRKKNACIVICDFTRPLPSKILLPPVLNILKKSGIDKSKIKILIAAGIHRPCTKEEIIEIVGKNIADEYKIINHKSLDKSTHINLGKTKRGTPIFINREYMESDLKILLGLIEPHLMAGFSGGRKLICPGISSIDTVKVVHSPIFLEDTKCHEGVTEGNPFHHEATEIAQKAGADFTLNVTINEAKKITGIFAGDLIEAHKKGVEFERQTVSDFVEKPVDIIVTTGAGHPLDTTFYQAIKGLTAALPIVNDDGTIVLAAECREGLGSDDFVKLLSSLKSIEDFDNRIIKGDEFYIDQWQVEELIKVLRKCIIILCSQNIHNNYGNKIMVKTTNSINEAINTALSRYGKNAEIVVIPEGPYVLANVK